MDRSAGLTLPPSSDVAGGFRGLRQPMTFVALHHKLCRMKEDACGCAGLKVFAPGGARIDKIDRLNNFGSVSFRLCKAENLVWHEGPTQRKVRCTGEWQILSKAHQL